MSFSFSQIEKAMPNTTLAPIHTYPTNNLSGRAAHIVKYAVRKGLIKVPNECDFCKTQSKVQPVHIDPSLPFEVLWACDRCYRNSVKVLSK